MVAALGKPLGTSETSAERARRAKLNFPQVTALIDQDIATIALLLFVVLYVLMFPGGPGTPRRLKNPWELARVKLEN